MSWNLETHICHSDLCFWPGLVDLLATQRSVQTLCSWSKVNSKVSSCLHDALRRLQTITFLLCVLWPPFTSPFCSETGRACTVLHHTAVRVLAQLQLLPSFFFFLSLFFLSFLSFTGSGVSRGQYFSRLHSVGSCCSDTQQLGWWVKFTTVYKDWCCIWYFTTFISSYSFECLFICFFFYLPDALYSSVFTVRSLSSDFAEGLFMKKVAFITLHGCSFTPISVSFLLIIREWFIDMEPVICLLWRNLCTVH